MPDNQYIDNYLRFTTYIPKNFEIILKGFDILSKHNSYLKNVDEKLLKKLDTNGVRSFVMRVLIFSYVAKHAEDKDSNGNGIFSNNFKDELKKVMEKEFNKYTKNLKSQ